jgi:hypothetical protein
LLKAVLARFTFATRVNEDADTDVITDREFADRGAHFTHDSSDLMTWDHREDRRTPFFTHLMYVRVADSSEGNINQNVVRAYVSPCEIVANKTSTFTKCGKTSNVCHFSPYQI